MKKLLIMVLAAGLAFNTAAPAWASDWDKAGIALTGIEGLRIITGGKVDLIGSMFGMNGEKNSSTVYRDRHSRYKTCTTRTWVPNYRWAREYVPEHEEYDPQYGNIVVEGHYIKYQIENGGYWREEEYRCG